MSSIDERIVRMRFDNAGFENGVKNTLSSLKLLGENLKMKGASEGLSAVENGIKGLNTSGISGLSSGVEAVTSRFSALQVMAVTALANITNSAVNAGKNLVKSLTIDPITTGFSEYEEKMTAIQTVLTNTASKGTTIKDVTAALDELNTYADQTIYSFGEMTKNIGTFTAAGVDLETSVMAIKGISNLAAGSGSSPQQAATAMYQLSQALAAGKVGLQDWNSVVNAGMGGEMFQKELVSMAKGMGVVVDESKPFRETLKDGWLTTDVLLGTLQKFSKDPSLLQAATQVKTLSGLLDTMKESVQSGWAVSMEHIFGNKDQAAKLFTAMSEGFNSIIGPSTDARNAMLKFWNETGGRDAVIAGLTNIVQSLGKVLGSVGKAFKEVFPSITGKQLVAFSKGFEDLTNKFKINDGIASKIGTTFKGVFSIFKLGGDIVAGVVKALLPLGGVLLNIGEVAVTITSGIGRLVSTIARLVSESGVIDFIGTTIANTFNAIGKYAANMSKALDGLFDGVSKIDLSPLQNFMTILGSGVGKGLTAIFEGLGKLLSQFDLGSFFKAFSLLTLIEMIKSTKGMVDSFSGIGESISEMFGSFKGISDNISGVLDGVRGSLEAYQNSLNVGTLFKIAATIALLAGALMVLSSLDEDELTTGLTGITLLFAELVGAMILMLKVVGGSKLKGIFAMANMLIVFAGAITMLAVAVKILSDLEWKELAVGLSGVLGIMTMVVAASKLMSGKSKGIIKASTGMLIMSGAIIVLVQAVKMLSNLDAQSLMRGLTGVGLLLAQLAIFMSVTNFSKMGILNSVGVLVLAAALNVMYYAIRDLSKLDANAMIKGLTGIGVILLEIMAFTKLIGRGGNLLTMSAGLVALGIALNIMAVAVKTLGGISWNSMVKGLTSMSGSLLIISAACKLINPIKLAGIGVGLGIMSASMIILSAALQSLGNMSGEQIAISLTVLASALTIFAIAMATMKTGIAGAASMVVMAGALALLTPQLLILGQMNLMQLGVSLLALAGIFTVFGLAGLVLAPMAPALLVLGLAVAALGVGCMAAGAGISLFAAGLAALAVSGWAGIAVLLDGIRQFIALLPSIAVKVAEAFVAFIQTIATNIPLVVEAIGQIISGVLQAIAEALPQIMDAFVAILTSIVTVISEHLPMIVELGIKILKGLLEGVLSCIGDITSTAVEIIVVFLNTISDNLGRIIQAGLDFAIKFINGVADGIRNNKGPIIDAIFNILGALLEAILSFIGKTFDAGGDLMDSFAGGITSFIGNIILAAGLVVKGLLDGLKKGIADAKKIGSDIIGGLVKGIKDKVGDAIAAAKGVVGDALQAARNLLGIHSPSRKFAEVGKFSVMGFAKGLKDNSRLSTDSATTLANKTLNSMSKPLSKLADIIGGEIDATPVIAPIMDLSNIKNGSKTIGQLMSNQSDLQLKASFAGGLTKGMRTVQNGNDNGDIIAALKDLGNKIVGSGGDTNIVNGVSYNDGSNVSEAIKTLTRAATIERRI